MKAIYLLSLAFSLILCDLYYKVESGDNLTRIANKFGTTVAQLCLLNNITNPNLLFPGQRLIIRKDPPPPPIPGQLVTSTQMQKMGWLNYKIDELNNCLKKFNINTPARIRHFISQCSYKSTCGKYNVEQIGASNCSQYDGKMGNELPGDGCRFKGVGYIHLTGRSNYKAFSNYIHDPRVMEGYLYVAYKYPWTSAGFWWHHNNMNSLCDSGASFETISKKVNGGYEVLSEIRRYYELALKIF